MGQPISKKIMREALGIKEIAASYGGLQTERLLERANNLIKEAERVEALENSPLLVAPMQCKEESNVEN